MEPLQARREDFNTAFVLDILLARGLVDASQRREIEVREPGQRNRIVKEHGAKSHGHGRGAYWVSPIELVASFMLEMPDGRKVDQDLITQEVASSIGLPYLKIDPLKLDAKLITTTFSRPFARRHGALPLQQDDRGHLQVAVSNPFDADLLETLRVQTGREIVPVLAARADIQRFITDVYGFGGSVKAAARDVQQGADLGNLEQLIQLRGVQELEATDKHVVAAVEYMFHFALEQRASDIHVEPKRDNAMIRFRIDGVLHNIRELPKVVHSPFISRLKMLARLDIAERRRPQDGRIKTGFGDREIEMRVSTMPVAFGEKIVIRIFDPDILLKAFPELGLEGIDLERYERFVERTHGLLLVTGPTGSGKTTTLYSTLRRLATDDVNVTSIEDPIELIYPEFNQVSVQPRAGIDFATALRTLLRQDPDILMVGEIRDLATADAAVQAALTGHLVLSTLHTNDTASSINRLLELGVQPFLVSSTLVGVVAQRLIRTVCEKCAVDVHLASDEIAALELPVRPGGATPQLKVKRGQGCVNCRGTGLRGRIGIFEVLEMTDKLRTLVNSRAPSTEIMKAARQDGLTTLREAAVRALATGRTSFEEVIRITSGDIA